MVRAAGHEAGSQGAHVGTVAGEADATDHPLNIGFMQAGGGAVLASRNACVEGVELALGVGGHGICGCGEESVGQKSARARRPDMTMLAFTHDFCQTRPKPLPLEGVIK